MTKVICVVNDVSKDGSTLKAEHGLSLWIELEHSNVLFDTGQSAEVLEHNLSVLGLLPIKLDALVFSHAHLDHTGGVAAIFPERTTIPLHAHSDLFRARYSLKDDVYKTIGISMKESELSHHFYLKLNDEPVEIAPNLWTTGSISNRSERAGSSKSHLIHDVNGWQHDPYLDDISLVLKTSAGNVLICGCCHAGILNTLYHVENVFGGPIIAVIGGTHLISAEDEYLDYLTSIFQDRYPNCQYYLNHCTGKKTIERLTERMGSQIRHFPAGEIVSFPL